MNSNEIYTSRLVITTPEGKTCAILQAGSDEVVSLDLLGPGGTGLSLCIDSDGLPKIGFAGPNGRTGLSIGISSHLGAGLSLHDAEGRPVGFIHVGASGVPKISFYQTISEQEARLFWETPSDSIDGAY